MKTQPEKKLTAADFGYRPTMTMKQLAALGARLTSDEMGGLALILGKTSKAHLKHADELEAYTLAKFGPDEVTT